MHATTSPLLTALKTLGPGDHLCLIYETDEERQASVIPFLAFGLERGERCCYLANDTASDDILREFQDHGIATDALNGASSLTVLRAPEVYAPDAVFDPDRMIRFLIQSVEAATADGHPALRAVGEMTWALGEGVRSDRLIEYEARLNTELFQRHPCLAICLYDARRFSPETLNGIIETHPLVVYGNRVCRNPYYVSPDEFRRQTPSQAVKSRLKALHDQQEMLDDTMSARAHINRLLESTSQGIYGLDQEGRCTFINKAGAEMLGYRPDELVGCDMHKRMHYAHPDGSPYPVEDCLIYEAFRAGRKFKIEDEVLWRRDGSSFPVAYASHPIIREGMIEGAVVTFDDITERRNTDTMLRELAVVSEQTGDRFFGELTKFLCRSLRVDYAFVGELREELPARPLRTRALHCRGALVENRDLTWAGYPCETVLTQGPQTYPQGLQQRFPNATLLAEMDAESYCGRPLCASDGSVIGTVCVLDSKPLADPPQAELVLSIIANRAAAELERLRMERSLFHSVEEKEVLLKEVHHRVKNNLQVISSLLNLQAGPTTDAGVRGAFQDSQNRIIAMALIHETLYRSSDLTAIDMEQYVRRLVEQMILAFGMEATTVTIEASSLRLGLDHAVPCGLILNELLSNAFIHAFPDAVSGHVMIELKEEHGVLLRVRDTGKGLPKGLDARHATTLGYRIVGALADQLGGAVDVTAATPGTEVTLRFPLKGPSA